MNREFEDIVKRLSPTLRRITHKLNGHFSFFDDEDLFQEALAHLWVYFQKGILADKTDSYILQGCYFYLKNYLRTTLDKARLISLSQLMDDEDSSLEDILAIEEAVFTDDIDTTLLTEAAAINELTAREKEVLSFSLDGLTVREIGRRLGISHVMVIKLKNKIKIKCQNLKNKCKTGYQN